MPKMIGALPACMLAPWREEFAEGRISDISVANMAEFKAYIAKHTGPDKRFIDPHFLETRPCVLFRRSRADIGEIVLNYLRRDYRYDVAQRNCQGFAADLFSILTGKKVLRKFQQSEV